MDILVQGFILAIEKIKEKSKTLGTSQVDKTIRKGKK